MVTSSSSGLYGNFGQTNYGAAKMGVVGMMNTLAQEGAKYNVKINALAPTAGTRMTEGLIDEKGVCAAHPRNGDPGRFVSGVGGRPDAHDPCGWGRALTRWQKLSRPRACGYPRRNRPPRASRHTGSKSLRAASAPCKRALSRASKWWVRRPRGWVWRWVERAAVFAISKRRT